MHKSTAERREAGRKEDPLVSVVPETSVLFGQLYIQFELVYVIYATLYLCMYNYYKSICGCI